MTVTTLPLLSTLAYRIIHKIISSGLHIYILLPRTDNSKSKIYSLLAALTKHIVDCCELRCPTHIHNDALTLPFISHARIHVHTQTDAPFKHTNSKLTHTCTHTLALHNRTLFACSPRLPSSFMVFVTPTLRTQTSGPLRT